MKIISLSLARFSANNGIKIYAKKWDCLSDMKNGIKAATNIYESLLNILYTAKIAISVGCYT